MTFDITAPYAAALAVLCIVLVALVLANRGRSHVPLGAGGDVRLQKAIRRHANLAENLPLALILMALAEAGGMTALWLHGTGALLLASRLLHPLGIDATNPVTFGRIAGTSGTLIAMLIPVVFLARTDLMG